MRLGATETNAKPCQGRACSTAAHLGPLPRAFPGIWLRPAPILRCRRSCMRCVCSDGRTHQLLFVDTVQHADCPSLRLRMLASCSQTFLWPQWRSAPVALEQSRNHRALSLSLGCAQQFIGLDPHWLAAPGRRLSNHEPVLYAAARMQCPRVDVCYSFSCPRGGGCFASAIAYISPSGSLAPAAGRSLAYCPCSPVRKHLVKCSKLRYGPLAANETGEWTNRFPLQRLRRGIFKLQSHCANRVLGGYSHVQR